MDGQNFENENNVTVDTTATEVSSTAEPAQETPAAEQPANNYQDYTTNVQPQVAVTTPVQPENKDTNVLAIISLVLGILSIVLGSSAARISWLRSYEVLVPGIRTLISSHDVIPHPGRLRYSCSSVPSPSRSTEKQLSP